MKEKENVAHRRQSKNFPVKEIYDNIAIYAPMIYTAGPVQIHYEGKWEEVGPWKSRLFWAL
jgi:hypothetical protein